MFSSYDQDDGVAWPSYVDFMSTFIFVLIIFIGGLLYILSGDIGERNFHAVISRTQASLAKQNMDYKIEGRTIRINLNNKVRFDKGCPDPEKHDCPSELSDENKSQLRAVALIIGQNARAKRIVIEGRADATPYLNGGKPDDFKNIKLSERRAEQVFQFLWQCGDCGPGYNVEEVHRVLVLSALGTRNRSVAAQQERRVDVVLDYSDGLE